MKVSIIYESGYSNHSHGTLESRFLSKLQAVIDNGGFIISITRDNDSGKKAYVLTD